MVLVLPILTACDDDNDDGITVTVTETATATASATSTTTTHEPTTTAATSTEVTPTTSDEPVKIGATLPMSGSMGIAGLLAKSAIQVVEKQVQERGGIQVDDVRRPLEVIIFDDKGDVSGTIAGWSKLVRQDDVSVIFGGAGGAQLLTGAEQATEYEVPFIDYGGTPISLADYPYAARSGYSELATAGPMAELIDDLKPKTVGLLGDEEEADHVFFEYLKEKVLAPRDIEVVYEQYITLGTTDISPYLTRIQYEDPDLLIHFTAVMATAGATFKQIEELGGWGDITYLGARSPQSSYIEDPGAEGTYLFMVWTPVMDNPGTRELLEAWDKYGSGEINPIHVYFYNALWMAIHAIESAGSDDPRDIIETLRSGNFTYESPFGTVKIGTDGENGYPGVLVLVGKDGAHTIAYE